VQVESCTQRNCARALMVERFCNSDCKSSGLQRNQRRPLEGSTNRATGIYIEHVGLSGRRMPTRMTVACGLCTSSLEASLFRGAAIIGRRARRRPYVSAAFQHLSTDRLNGMY